MDLNRNAVNTEKTAQRGIVSILILFFVLSLFAGLAAGSYWTFTHQDELMEPFSPKKNHHNSSGEGIPGKAYAPLAQRID